MYSIMEEKEMKDLFKKYSHVKWLILCSFLYLTTFFILEQWGDRPFWVVDTWLDAYIPFNEYMIIPYVLWYFYIVIGFVYFTVYEIEGFNRTQFYLWTGMFVAMIFCAIVPNCQNMRVELANENIFQSAVSFLYSIDTNTNVFPSIHCYNSIMMMASLLKSDKVRSHKILSIFIVVLSISICASTVMLKQHGILDVFGAIGLSIIVYLIGKYKFNF